MGRCRLLIAYSKVRAIATRRCSQTGPHIWNILPTMVRYSGECGVPTNMMLMMVARRRQPTI